MIHRNTPSTEVLALGTYRLKNAHTFTSQVWEVSADEVRVFTAPTGSYAATFLRAMTHAEAVETMVSGAYLGYAAPIFTAAEAPAQPEVIGNATACELHKELARLRFTDHYGTASDALGYPVSSLAALTADEAYTVRSYARGQWGMSA